MSRKTSINGKEFLDECLGRGKKEPNGTKLSGAEQGLREVALEAIRNRAQLEAVFQAMSDGVVVFDMNGDAVLVNEAEARINGFSSSGDMKRSLEYFKNVYELSGSDGRPVPADEWPASKVLRGETVKDWELHGRRLDTGQQWFFSFSGEPVRDDQGRQILAVIVTRDITQRKQWEQAVHDSEVRFRTLADNIAQLAWTADEKGDRDWFNKRWYEYTGTTYDQVKGRGWQFLHHPDYRAAVFEKMERCIASGQAWEDTVRLRGRDGAYRWFLSRAIPIRNGQGAITQWFGTNTDITDLRKVQEELKVREQQYKTLSENAPEIIARLDRELRYLYINAYGEKVYGRPREEVIGKTNAQLGMSPDRVAFWTRNLEQVLETGLQRTIEFDDGSPEHGQQHFSSILVPEFDERGDAASILAITRDITRVKQAEDALRRSEQRIRATFDNAGVGILEVDGADRFIAVNDRVCEMLGYRREELLKMSVHELTAPGDRARSDELNARLHEGEFDRFSYEKRYLRRDGSPLWASVTVSAVRDSDGRQIRSIATIEDISERRRVEEEREQLIRDLERSNRELEQFAYVSSHDLQEPLRMVASYVQLLERKYHGRLDQTADKYIHYAVDGAVRMQKLIDGLLAYSRISRQAPRFKPVDTGHLFDGLVSLLAGAIREAGALITRGDLPVVQGEEVQLLQLLQNLVVNALSFRKPGMSPEIHVSASRQKGEWLFSVSDNGIGIEPQYFDRIFKIFQRLHGRAEYPGTGIGLALSKRIVERHGGRIWVDSVPGKGTTFFFTLPAEKDAAG